MNQSWRLPFVDRTLAEMFNTVNVADENVARFQKPLARITFLHASESYAVFVDGSIGNRFNARNRQAAALLRLFDR
jgi:hypothetical protein